MPPTLRLAALLGTLVTATACATLAPRPPTPMPPARVAPTVAPSVTPDATSSVTEAPVVETCPAGKAPAFEFGFAILKERLRDRMGEPLTCERPGPNGDTLQQTTTGMAQYRKSTNTPTFTTGTDHWALTDGGLVHWTGRSLEPPVDAQLVSDDELAQVGSAEASTPGQPAAATPLPFADGITLPADQDIQVEPGLPEWVQKPLALLREYDRRNGTLLVPAIIQAGVSVGQLGGSNGAWGMFVPSSHRIVLDGSLSGESPQAVAPVLGHEADHARDTFQYGPPRSDAACYTFEITAVALEARIWASIYGPAGKPDPRTDLEKELNLILRTSHTSADTLITAIKDNYQAECG